MPEINVEMATQNRLAIPDANSATNTASGKVTYAEVTDIEGQLLSEEDGGEQSEVGPSMIRYFRTAKPFLIYR